MSRPTRRPLSPHIQVWKWGPHMAVSILHRATGDTMATLGVIGLIWWLVAAATGKEAYDQFLSVATSWFGIVVGIGLTWTFCEHMFSGIRHLVLDTGAGYELRRNKFWAVALLCAAPVLTILVWAYILGVK